VISRWLPPIFYIGGREISEACDLAVLSLILQKNNIGKGSIAWVNVTIANNGSYVGAFNVTLSANSIVIETRTNITLSTGETKTLRLYWNCVGT